MAFINRLLLIWQAEPARVVGFVAAILAAAVALGLPLTEDQTAKIVTAVAAALFLLGSAELTRSRVTPAAKSVEAVDAAFLRGHNEGIKTGSIRAGTIDVPSDNLTTAAPTEIALRTLL